MTKYLLPFFLLAAAPAFAQDAPPTSYTLPPSYTLTVTQADLTNLSLAIQELPFKIAQPLMVKLNDQINAQVQAAKPKVAPPGPSAPVTAPNTGG